MNEKLNLVEILKDCPSGTKLYSPALGEVDFVDILEDCTYNIRVKGECGTFHFTPQGKLFNTEQGECILFPSKDNYQRKLKVLIIGRKHKFVLQSYLNELRTRKLLISIM